MSFTTSLRFGEAGEALWFQAQGGELRKIDGFKGDFEYVATGEKLELKTDLWDMNKTPNLFIERWSDVAKQSPGGPWQAQAHGCKWFTYFYVANLTYYTWPVASLIARLEDVLPSLTPTEVHNRTYTTVGYRVPRDLLVSLAEKTKLKVVKE